MTTLHHEEEEERGGPNPNMEEEKALASNHTDDLVDDIVSIIKYVKTIGEFRKPQGKECICLVRRMKLFLPFLEDIKQTQRTSPDAGLNNLKRLRTAFRSAKKLLKTCHSGSKIFLALESEAVMVAFHSVYDNIYEATKKLPYDELGISEEAKEQVRVITNTPPEIELLRAQVKRAKGRNDTQDMELAMDLMVATSKNDDRNADSATVERLANTLSLRTAEDVQKEAIAIRKLIKERRGHQAETTQQMVSLLDKFKHLAGVVEDGMHNEAQHAPNSLLRTESIAIPNEFLCPITLAIMTDPVIVATGQTYERESIQQWLDSNHSTCPKTGQILSHLSLAPNFALKNLIIQWCEKNKMELPKKVSLTTSGNPSTTTDERKILSSIKNLSSTKLDKQRDAVKNIRLLSKESPENRILIAKNKGIPPLVQLLSYPESRIQEHAVTAILNLSIEESNKKLISREGPIPSIIEILQKGTTGAKENSAAALFSLSMVDENKVKIGSLNGIPPLVDLLRSGTIRGKKDAATALFNLCLNQSNKTRAIEAGIVSPLIKVLNDKKLEMVNESLSLLLILASNHKGRQELGQLPFIESLVGFIREGSPKNKECATAVLLELGSSNHNLVLAALQYGVYEHLVDVCKNGTERGQRKANALLNLMSKTEQIP